jgi:ligand-binding sensor domain-containing protein
MFTTTGTSRNPEWVVYDESNSGLPSSWVYCITIDGSDTKWIGSHTYEGHGGHLGDGLTQFDNSAWIVHDSLNTELPNNSVFGIATDAGGSIWIVNWRAFADGGLVPGGLTEFDGSNWVAWDQQDYDELRCIAIDQMDTKWIGTFYGLLRFDGEHWTDYDTSNSDLPHNYVNCIAIDDSGKVWVGTDGGLAVFNGSSWTIYNRSNSGLPWDIVSCIAIDQFDDKWIGTGGPWAARYSNRSGKGLAKYDGSNWTVYDTSNSGLPSDEITCLAMDDFGNKWIGTTAGLVRFNGTLWDVYDESNSGLPSDDIWSLAVDAFGNKWIGTWDGLGVFNESGIVSVEESDIPGSILPLSHKLSQNYPNPFNPSTTIEFALPHAGYVTLKVYNVLGEEVAALVEGDHAAGTFKATWDASGLPSGVYFYRLTAGEYVQTKKMILMK